MKKMFKDTLTNIGIIQIEIPLHLSHVFLLGVHH